MKPDIGGKKMRSTFTNELLMNVCVEDSNESTIVNHRYDSPLKLNMVKKRKGTS
jgi:hypothetical protein